MSDHIISLLFPTPILSTNIDRDFTKEELAFADKHEKETVLNVGNRYSINDHILGESEFADLKKFCMSVIQSYIDNVTKPKNDITPYITQSWLTYTDRGDFMHTHNHANSYLSGVLYLNADNETDTICFHDQTYRQIVVPSDTYDISNSSRWLVPVSTGDIVIFPSYLHHSVPNLETDKTRISLAFNVFIDGDLGSPELLTGLKLRNRAR